MDAPFDEQLSTLWSHLGGDASTLARVSITGAPVVLPAVFDVTGFAAACVGVANLAAAELVAARGAGTRPVPTVEVDRRQASAAFVCERLLVPDGWELPPIWDPVAGDYEAADGWIRLHTNYRHHREALLSVVGTAAERSSVAAAVATWKADELEQAVVEAGGCAAAMRTVEGWAAHPASAASAHEVPVQLGEAVPVAGHLVPLTGSADDVAQPLAGVRVLDLTRVMAGPVATRFLAAHGADVLRIDPPGFEEVGAIVPEMARGKRCTALDLRDAADRSTFERLVADAHVIVSGFRPGAMSGLGYDSEALRRLNPALVTVTHDAYGWSGLWAARRGFDSLVQMSTGIAAAGQAALGLDRPFPLPAQALDHGIGFLLAAGACRALTRLMTDGVTADVRGSLVGAANHLLAHPTPHASAAPAATWTDDDREATQTGFGPARQVPIPGRIDGHPAAFAPDRLAGPLGGHAPAFAPR